jgi:hypothetical protein
MKNKFSLKSLLCDLALNKERGRQELCVIEETPALHGISIADVF